MAYQPVERDAGKIMYEAALRRGQTIGGAITDWTNTLYQRQEENKQFDAKVKALEQVYKQNAPQFGFKTPEELTQFLAQDMNQTPKERYARLATFLEDKIVASREQRTQQLQEAQAANLQAEAAKSKLDAARTILNLSEVGFTPEQLQGAINFGTPTGVIITPTGSMRQAPAAPGTMPQPAPAGGGVQPTVGGVTPAIPNIPPELMAGVSTQAAGVKPPSAALQTMLGVSPQSQPSGVGGGLRQVTGEFFPSEVEAAAKQKARLDALAGKSSNWITNARDLMQERRKAAAEERELTLEQGNQLQEQFNVSEKDKPAGQRRSMILRASTRPGYVSPEIVIAEPTALEKKTMEAETQAEKDKLTRIGAVISEDRKTAATSRTLGPALGTLDKLISEERLDEGSSASLIASVRSLGQSFGFPIDEKRLADAQVAKQAFGQLVIPLFINTKGATSDKDAVLFQSWSPQLGLNNKANAQMLGVLQKRVKLDRDLERLGMQVDSGDITPQAYIKERQKMLRDYDDSIPSIDEFLKKSGEQERKVADAAGPAPVPRNLIRNVVDQAVQQGGSASQELFDRLLRSAPNQPNALPTKRGP